MKSVCYRWLWVLVLGAVLSACGGGGGGGSDSGSSTSDSSEPPPAAGDTPDTGNPGDAPPASLTGDLKVLAANDLGMHCADLDYQVFSILPPFNVLHAQVIQRGSDTAMPRLLGERDVDLTYHAVSNPDDPIGGGSLNTTSLNLPGVYKSNFWADSGHPVALTGTNGNNSVGGLGYRALYPSVLAGSMIPPSAGGPLDLQGECSNAEIPTGCPAVLDLFEPLADDNGLPVPDPNAMQPGAGGSPQLVARQQRMPGLANLPQPFGRFDADVSFFTGLPFGARIANTNWFAADGIPIMPVDDSGRDNAYPLMRVVARDKQDGTGLSSVDVVLPVAAEADCKDCHVDPIDCSDPALPAPVQSSECLGAAVTRSGLQVVDIDAAPGETREQQLINAAKLNILALHDLKHGATYRDWDEKGDLAAAPCDTDNDPAGPNCLVSRIPVQCSWCHYSPALDLAQVGPLDESQQGRGGRQQTRHVSMSNAMHRFHGELPPFEGQPLFPAMPGPQGRSDADTATVLQQTCYRCHPGKRTQCLRGAMFAGGVVCQDCHGGMQQIGDDFSNGFPSNPYPDGADLAKRVPWATEPGCQSCHTGDALHPNHPSGATVAEDGIRLIQAYLDSDPHTTPIASADSRFAENQALYRLSGNDDASDKGHHGVKCEGCHGSTHAIWPIQNPAANDNLAAEQLQGHAGVLIECTTCHDAGDFDEGGSLRLTLGGPHGMHPVGSDTYWGRKHEHVAEDDADSCRACHGLNGEGTVLSRMAVTRTLRCDDEGRGECDSDGRIVLQAGTPVGCAQCHENKLGEGGEDDED